MQNTVLVRGACLRWSLPAYGVKLAAPAFRKGLCRYSAAADSDKERADGKVGSRNEWYVLPPFSPTTIDASALGKKLTLRHTEQDCETSTDSDSTMTALQWVLRSCPQVPRSLIQKLFRLRQVRREYYKMGSGETIQVQVPRHKRVAGKDFMNKGDRICLPISVKEIPSRKPEISCKKEEINFVRSLVLYKDPMIIAVNKPPGMPVQGGIGVKRSLDELAVTCLKYDFSDSESPRLVHRLDRDSSGILVMATTQESATLLHSIFREKTCGALKHDSQTGRKILQRRYWALVFGSPNRSSGLISAPLGKGEVHSHVVISPINGTTFHKGVCVEIGIAVYDKLNSMLQGYPLSSSFPSIREVVMDSGKSERITVIGSHQDVPSQHAITEYRVISSYYGYTWLELSPLTGRKHQLRVHCAEVLGTPIVGDYKYGRVAHKNWKEFPSDDLQKHMSRTSPRRNLYPFGLDLDNGSIAEKRPHLHLHCKHMVLPNVSLALRNLQLSSDCDLSDLEDIKLVAPLPSHMQKSWEILNS